VIRLHGVYMCIGLIGCGRVGFDARDDATRDDATRDVAELATRCGQITGELFCEGFEGEPMLGSLQATAPSFALVETTHSFRGARALHARTEGAQEPAWVLGTVLPDLVAGELHARWYIYVPSGAAKLELASVHLVDAVFPHRGVIVGVHEGMMDLTATETGDYLVSQVAVPRDRWACVQLHVTISQTAGVVESWLDGVSTGRFTGIDTLPAVSYRSVHAGMFATSLATEPQELWTDELAVATLPIACD
jgi:hypothetical protein